MPEDLKAVELISRYRFVLSAFGLDFVRTQIYRPGKSLDAKKENSSYTVQHSDKGTPNMHTGINQTSGGTAVKTGKQPISPLGTPVFSDLILHKQNQNEEQGVQLIWCLVEVEQSRNIVKTAIQGRDGTVKEYISDGDYQVTLRGAIARTFQSNYPKEELKRFLELLKEKKSLKVVSEYLLLFNIYELVVDSYTMGQDEGLQNVQKFEIKCSSDVPLVLRKKQNVFS